MRAPNTMNTRTNPTVSNPTLIDQLSTIPRVNCVPDTFQPSRDPITGWNRRNGNANQYEVRIVSDYYCSVMGFARSRMRKTTGLNFDPGPSLHTAHHNLSPGTSPGGSLLDIISADSARSRIRVQRTELLLLHLVEYAIKTGVLVQISIEYPLFSIAVEYFPYMIRGTGDRAEEALTPIFSSLLFLRAACFITKPPLTPTSKAHIPGLNK